MDWEIPRPCGGMREQGSRQNGWIGSQRFTCAAMSYVQSTETALQCHQQAREQVCRDAVASGTRLTLANCIDTSRTQLISECDAQATAACNSQPHSVTLFASNHVPKSINDAAWCTRPMQNDLQLCAANRGGYGTHAERNGQSEFLCGPVRLQNRAKPRMRQARPGLHIDRQAAAAVWRQSSTSGAFAFLRHSCEPREEGGGAADMHRASASCLSGGAQRFHRVLGMGASLWPPW